MIKLITLLVSQVIISLNYNCDGDYYGVYNRYIDCINIKHKIEICMNYKHNYINTFLHELGHYYRHNKLIAGKKQEFRRLVGNNNVKEKFAEAFACWYGDIMGTGCYGNYYKKSYKVEERLNKNILNNN